MMDDGLIAPVRYLRDSVIGFVETLGQISMILVATFSAVIRGRVTWQDIMNQMAVIGVRSVTIAILTTFCSGAVIALYFADFFVKYGVGNLTGAAVAMAFSRELGPVLVAVVVAARSGSAIAAEIGTMRVTEQIDALRALAVSPIEYLAAPRVLACLVMLPILCVLGDYSGVIGGYVVAVWKGVTSSSYPESIRTYTIPRDYIMGMVKTIVFGLIIAAVGCHKGLTTEGGATGVGKATTGAVVLSIVLIYVSDFFLAYAMF
jgi:phospholipid/cholesterol/gamma-HCH transport system permease protein